MGRDPRPAPLRSHGPGRCAANVGFDPLTPVEASAWLTERGVDAPVTEPTILASLFARPEGGASCAPLPSIGFPP